MQSITVFHDGKIWLPSFDKLFRVSQWSVVMVVCILVFISVLKVEYSVKRKQAVTSQVTAHKRQMSFCWSVCAGLTLKYVFTSKCCFFEITDTLSGCMDFTYILQLCHPQANSAGFLSTSCFFVQFYVKSVQLDIQYML